MSGIAGVSVLGGRRVQPAELQGLVDALAHRGPDGAGVWYQDGIGLGHRMLRTTPESLAERLPLSDSAGTLVLTADARIDNREELIRTLALGGRPPGQICDSELILAAYGAWGDRCPERLLGDFAFALWDDRERKLFCARDRFGSKPFYYHHQPGHLFAFASEMKALLRLAQVPRTLDEAWIGDYLAGVHEDRENTFYAAIRRLPPAHSLVITPGRSVLRRYWSLDPEREVRCRTDDEYAEAFRALFFEAVGCRLRCAFPLGASLSGGLDSSAVVCTARELLRAPGAPALHTYSWIFDATPECDERPFIQAVLAGGGLDSHFVQADALRPVEDSPRFFRLDQPPFAHNIGLDFGGFRLMQALGVRVVLDGYFGDTTVSWGVHRMTELLRAGRLIELALSVRQHARNMEVSTWLAYRKYFWWTFKREIVKPLLPAALLRRRRARRAPAEPGPGTVLNPEFARRLGLAERHRALTEPLRRRCRTVTELHFLELGGGVFTSSLELTDQVAAAHGLEARSPFLDSRLVEFCLALPSEQKFHRGWSRMILRRAMAGVLPEPVRWRGGKGDLGGWYLRGLRRSEAARVERTLGSEARLIEPYLDLAALREAERQLREVGSLAGGHALWRAMMLAAWLKLVDSGDPLKRGGGLPRQPASIP